MKEFWQRSRIILFYFSFMLLVDWEGKTDWKFIGKYLTAGNKILLMLLLARQDSQPKNYNVHCVHFYNMSRSNRMKAKAKFLFDFYHLLPPAYEVKREVIFSVCLSVHIWPYCYSLRIVNCQVPRWPFCCSFKIVKRAVCLAFSRRTFLFFWSVLLFFDLFSAFAPDSTWCD